FQDSAGRRPSWSELQGSQHLLSTSSVSVNTISQAVGGRSLKVLTAAPGTGQRYAPDETGAIVTRFGDELRRFMTERGMSTRQLADLVPCDACNLLRRHTQRN